MNRLTFLINLFFLLWFVSVVCGDHQKRDVHHKIVIQERRPRNSHKKGYRDHRNHHHSGHHYESNYNRQKHKPKGHKYHSLENYDSSYENNYEDNYKHKGHGSHYNHNRPDHHYHSLEASAEVSKPYHHEKYNPSSHHQWKPLVTTEEPNHYSSEYRQEFTITRKPKKNIRHSSFHFDFTTRSPLKLHKSHFDTPLYPPLDNFNSFTHKTTNHLDFIPKYETLPTFEESKSVFQSKQFPILNNTIVPHKTNYEVTEPNVEGTIPLQSIKPFILNITDQNIFHTTFKPFSSSFLGTLKNESKAPLKRGRIVRGKRKQQ